MERSEIEKMAKLARIKISDAEAESLRGEIDSIIGYVSELQKVAVGELGVPAKDEFPVRNVLRADDVPHDSGAYSDDLLQAAPDTKDGYIKVKKIL